jgi:toxin ParE1/3/4
VSGPPVHDGSDQLHPEAERQLNELDDWITRAASGEIARLLVLAILDHIDGILVLPLAGKAGDDVRPGMRTTTFRKRTLVAYEVDESFDELVVSILGVFHGGQDWEAALGEDQGDPEARR